MISAFWEMFKSLYAVDTLEGYTQGGFDAAGPSGLCNGG